MKVAVKYEQLAVDEAGNVTGHGAGDTLVRRLLKVFPGAQLVGPRTHRYADFDVMPLEVLDAENTVVINMDVIDSVAVWRVLHAKAPNPKIMNFVWWDTSAFSTEVEQAELALSAALFPTFANSERTAAGIRGTVKRLTVQPLAERARISWVNLGIRLEHALQREEPEAPVILYPAIYLSERKQPQLFIDIVSRVARDTPVKVEVRLAEPHLVSRMAMQLSQKRWSWVGPLTPTRHEYWERLAHTTAFLATAKEESYGLEYIEALVAGAIGIFPKAAWAQAILPAGYPFLYSSPAEAETMLRRAIADTEACRRELDAAAGGSFAHWLRDHHSDDAFETAIVGRVHHWFGPDQTPPQP
ncbi:MAG: hypothetical protein LBJ08_11840 [Bifidobacteriaceae bacterium]|jgi:hypothetical protein|nr:hypothetical protein [Bifidobacteriaceae bacterium]